MANCSTLLGPGAHSMIEGQLNSIMTKGDTAYTTAMQAMQAMLATFTSTVTDIGKWTPASPGANPNSTVLFVPPRPLPVCGLTEFTPPTDAPDPPADLSALEALLRGIVNHLTVWIGETPDPPDVVIEDRFLVLLDTYYATLTARLSAVLAASPIVTSTLARLEEWLQPGAVGMSAEVEQALRDRGRGEIDVTEFQAIQDATVDWLARGFSMPAGALDMKLARIRQEANGRRGALNRDVLIEAAKWERETRQFAIEKGLAYEANLRDSMFKTFAEARAIAGTWQANEIQAKLALVELYKARVQAFAAILEGLGGAAGAVGEMIRAKLGVAQWDLARYEAEVKTEIARTGFAVQKYDSDIKLQGVLVQEETARTGVLANNDERLVRREELQTSVALKTKDMDLQKLLELAKVSVSALDGIARTASQMASGVFAALNMSAGISSGLSQSNSSSCSESYSYDMTG